VYLMLKDTEVLYFDLDEFVVEVIRNDLMPYCLRSNMRPPAKMKDILHNIQEVKAYLSSRVLSLSRDNAKQIYAAFQIPQVESIENRVNICIKCKGVSIVDSYWVRGDNETVKWNNINIRQNKLRDILDLSLSGITPTLTTNAICPELTTKGLFRKGWIYLGDSLYLLKSDNTHEYVNTRMEVLASEVLECFDNRLDSIVYLSDIKETARGTAYVSICQNFVKEDQSFVEAWEVIEYCKREGIDFRSFCLEKWGNEFACIPVLDYIIINTDRHTQNYGFMMNNDTGRLEAVAPMFDLNCALVADYFKRDAADTLSQMFNTKETIQKLAYDYVEHTDLRFNEKAFITLAQNHVYKELRHIFERVYGRVQEMGLA
jgi:hypothetical protein